MSHAKTIENSRTPKTGIVRDEHTSVTLRRVAFVFLIVGVTIYLLRVFAPLFQQVLLAVFLIYLIDPIHHWLVRHRIPSYLSYALLAGVVLAIFAGVSFLVYDSFNEFTENIPAYEQKVNQFIDHTAAQLPGVDAERIKSALNGGSVLEQGVQGVQYVFGTISQVLGHGSMVLVFLIMLLIEHQSLKHRVIEGFGKERAQALLEGAQKVNKAVGKYIQVTTICNLVIGIFTGLVLFLFGVDSPILWGFIAFLLPFIPYVGPFVAATLPGLFAIIVLSNPWLGVVVLVILHISHFLIGNLLEPLLLGEYLKISPFMVLVFLVFWGLLWGVSGMILSVPLLAATKIIAENFSATKPLAALLSDSSEKDQKDK